MFKLVLSTLQGAHWQLGKKYGKYGNFSVNNMGGLKDISRKIWGEYGKYYAPKHYNVLIYDAPKVTWDLKTPLNV